MEQQNTNKKQKNILLKIGMIILFILLMIGISAGVSTVIYNNKNIPASSAVENGLSAYEIAVQYGYDGSVEDWLDSLSGKSAYDIAAENGYSGTETEWIAALESAANQKNETIKTASFSANGELIITLSDGTQLNLGKAVGENGKDGKDGHNGANGVNGKDGVGISSAKINSDGQLVLNFSNGNSVNLDKVVGMNGADGVGVTKSEINKNGELVLTYSNGQTYTLGSVIGAAGKDGVDGIDGVNGVDGKDGVNGSDGRDGADGKDGISITNAVVGDNGELVLTYSNGTTANLGAVVGKDGQDGIDGSNGVDGISVINAEITSDGELVLTYSNGQRSNLGNVIGANGKDGADGKDGIDGKDGTNGADGISVVKSEINSRGELVLTYSDGNIDNLGVVVGANGKDGKDGENGKDGTNGKNGKDGLNGTDGKDGVGIDNIVINSDGQLEITLTNGTSMNLGNIKGADGQNGHDGKDGQNGKDGTDGKDGISIEEATINSSGELVLSYSNGD
ncbi:MAG: hypothetical protein J1E34_04575, partial [Oscillospiraceae bacterium]|nr:hypothetical protein [Oscillospiraceae bacterium]